MHCFKQTGSEKIGKNGGQVAVRKLYLTFRENSGLTIEFKQ